MIIRKKLIKDIIKTIFVVITAASFIITSAIINSKIDNQEIGLLIIIGIPVSLYVVGFFRRIKLYPKECILSGTSLTINYYNNRTIDLSLTEIKELKILIHSQRTAILEFKYLNENGAYLTVQFRRAEYTNFIDFSKTVMGYVYQDEPPKVETIKDNIAKERSEFFSQLEWWEYLTEKKTIAGILKELLSENLLIKLFSVISLCVIIISRNYQEGQNNFFILLFMISIYVIYLIVGFILRLKGFSRVESIGHFIVGLLTMICYLGAGTMILAWILNLDLGT